MERDQVKEASGRPDEQKPAWEAPSLGELELREVESLAEIDLAFVMKSSPSDVH